jgi:hypothetical protein
MKFKQPIPYEEYKLNQYLNDVENKIINRIPFEDNIFEFKQFIDSRYNLTCKSNNSNIISQSYKWYQSLLFHQLTTIIR